MVAGTVVTVRALAGCVALVAIVAGAFQRDTGASVLAASTAAPAFVLNLRLTTTQALPPASLAALMAESSAIWRDGRIQLRWLPAGSGQPGGTPAASLPVVVMARVLPSPGTEAPWAVGELVRMQGSRALAIASLTGARRILEQSGQLLPRDLPALHDHRLGVVLGRAVAHEIGHYLLQSSSHADRGLMRAEIDAREFADPRSSAFRLDTTAQAQLARLAAEGMLPAAATGLAR